MSNNILGLCYAGCIIPIESATYPAKRLVKRRMIKTAIVKCTEKIHPPNTGWNFIDLALMRLIKAREE